MKKLFNESFDVLEKAISLRSARNTVLASNIANVDTPGYKAKDIRFEEVMSRYTEKKEHVDVLEKTDQMHIEPGKSLPCAATDPKHFCIGEEKDPWNMLLVSTERGTPNNVDIDREMAEISTNSIQYQAATQYISKKFEGLKTAITEGR